MVFTDAKPRILGTVEAFHVVLLLHSRDFVQCVATDSYKRENA